MRFSMFRGAIADGGRATPRPRHRIARSGPEIIARATKSKGNCSRRGATQVPHHQTDWRCSRWVRFVLIIYHDNRSHFILLDTLEDVFQSSLLMQKAIRRHIFSLLFQHAAMFFILLLSSAPQVTLQSSYKGALLKHANNKKTHIHEVQITFIRNHEFSGNVDMSRANKTRP